MRPGVCTGKNLNTFPITQPSSRRKRAIGHGSFQSFFMSGSLMHLAQDNTHSETPKFPLPGGKRVG